MSSITIPTPTSDSHTRWGGDYRFLLENLILKDFRVRYRSMSLGVLWSVVNPLVMMGVLYFVFVKILPNPARPDFAVFLLCGLVPYNLFSLGWIIGTTSLTDNAGLVKRVPVPREIFPIAGVLATCIHIGIQVLLLLFFVLITGKPVTIYWLLLPVLFVFEVIFVSGLSLATAGLNVYVRDLRYLVESTNTVLFWLVPVVYDFAIIPEQYHGIYQFNPLAALIFAFRNILVEGRAPAASLLTNLVICSFVVFAVGLLIFRTVKKRVYDHL